MKSINYIKLYIYLKDTEGLSSIASLRNIWRIRHLPNEFKNVVLEIVENRLYNVGDFSVEDVTLKYLVKEEQMKCIQAIFFLDWLRREPDNARAFMSSKRYRSPLPALDEEERTKLEQALKNAKVNLTNKENEGWYAQEDDTKSDIVIDSDTE